jgi:hypothetical protein
MASVCSLYNPYPSERIAPASLQSCDLEYFTLNFFQIHFDSLTVLIV